MRFAYILFLGFTLPLAAAERVPKINMDPSCRAAAEGNVGLAQSIDSCRQSELSAHDTLVKLWKSFPAADPDRHSCYRLTTTGTPGTYTELLTCLEMRRDARALPNPSQPKQYPVETVGSARTSHPRPPPYFSLSLARPLSPNPGKPACEQDPARPWCAGFCCGGAVR